MISSYSQFLLTKNNFIFTNSGSYLIYMCPKSAQNPENQSKLVHTYSPKCPVIAISLNYSLVCAGALGALGRRFESCRPDQLYQ